MEGIRASKPTFAHFSLTRRGSCYSPASNPHRQTQDTRTWVHTLRGEGEKRRGHHTSTREHKSHGHNLCRRRRPSPLSQNVSAKVPARARPSPLNRRALSPSRRPSLRAPSPSEEREAQRLSLASVRRMDVLRRERTWHLSCPFYPS